MFTAALFDQFRLTQAERDLGVYGVHVYQEGEGEIEHRFRADDRVQIWSASKTFTSAAVGICLDEGRFALSDPVIGFFPEQTGTCAPGSESITVRDLLQMRSGKEYDLFQEQDPHLIATTDWAELFFRGDLVTRPGTHFYYANAASYLLGRIVEKTSGQVLRDYLMPRLFDPLDILNPSWNACPRGHSAGAFGLQLTTSELARMGRLLLQSGVWGDRQLVPADYVAAMHTDVVSPANHFGPDPESNAGYGYQVWLNTTPGTWRLDGKYGQFSIIIPDKRAVVTATSHNETHANDIIRAIFTDICPRL